MRLTIASLILGNNGPAGWVKSSQGLGLLDVELIKESKLVLVNSQKESEMLKFYRQMVLSKLLVIGAYELVRNIDKMTPTNKKIFDEEIKKEIRETIKKFTRVRVPLAKLEKSGRNIFQVAYPIWLPDVGAGWKIESEVFSRRELSDDLLNLLKEMRNV